LQELNKYCVFHRNVYWTDWGLETIEMADYDGANRKVIITRKGSWMNGLALNVEGWIF